MFFVICNNKIPRSLYFMLFYIRNVIQFIKKIVK
jgi:hypothetical protein